MRSTDSSANHSSASQPHHVSTTTPHQKTDELAQQLIEGAGSIKNAVVGIDSHRIVPHRYEARSIEPTVHPKTGELRSTSVAGIFDPEGITGRGKVGDYKVRFDQSHDYMGKQTGPHINIGRGEHIAIKVPAAIVDAAGVAARALEGVDRIAVPVGVAVDSARIANAIHQDGGKIGEHTVHAARSVAGGWAGALAGAAVGAEAGGFVGAVGGPPGIAAGTVAGGLIGGIAGSFCGSRLGDNLEAGALYIRYAGRETEAAPGYRQRGVITSVQDGVVTQHIGRGTAEYKLSDLMAGAADPAAAEKLLSTGHEVQICVDRNERFCVTSIERNHDLYRTDREGR